MLGGGTSTFDGGPAAEEQQCHGLLVAASVEHVLAVLELEQASAVALAVGQIVATVQDCVACGGEPCTEHELSCGSSAPEDASLVYQPGLEQALKASENAREPFG